MINRILRFRLAYFLIFKVRPVLARYFFVFLCVCGLMWYALYTNYIIGQLEEEARKVTNTYADLIRAAISDKMSEEQINVVFERVIRDTDIPIIVTDTNWNPTMWKNISAGGFLSDSMISPEDTSLWARNILKRRISDFKIGYDPEILTKSQSNRKIGYLVYGDNRLLRSLATWMPLLELALLIAFVLFVYLAFHNIRVTERNNLWVGLAKETAHQLGTPISSLMGWVEYMRSLHEADEEIDTEAFMGQLDTICNDMDNDLQRLRNITARFSQIGSKPDLANCDLNSIIEDATKYFRSRLPLLSRKIEIKLELTDIPIVAMNRDLMEWVFENLLKNSIDAIEKNDGLIKLRTEYIEVDKVVRVYHSDNGKGISWEDQKKVFSPGFTTKKRGWGLGLTLAKRIVEDYHNGYIYVNSSQKDKGTMFCVDLPVSKVYAKRTIKMQTIPKMNLNGEDVKSFKIRS